MTRIFMAFPAAILLLSFSVSAKAQSLVDGPGSPQVAPHLPQAQPASSAHAAAIVVRPSLTDEQMADLPIAPQASPGASQPYKRTAGHDPKKTVSRKKPRS